MNRLRAYSQLKFKKSFVDSANSHLGIYLHTLHFTSAASRTAMASLTQFMSTIVALVCLATVATANSLNAGDAVGTGLYLFHFFIN
jgi:hypothetical protein